MRRSIPFMVLLVSLGCDPKTSSDPDDGGSDAGADGRVVTDAAPIGDVDPTPDAAGGSDDVFIPDPDGGAALEPLSLNSLIPNRGLASGGTAVRIIGTGFNAGTVFLFGGTPCTEIEIESQHHARCVTPQGMPGAVVVGVDQTVVGIAGEEVRRAMLADAFTYFERVTLTSVTPERSPLRGGVELIMTGVGFVEGSVVLVDGNRAQDIVLQPNGTITALAPAGEPGPANVSVGNINGIAELQGAIFYYEPLDVTAVDPPIGPLGGGLRAILRGEGMPAATRVTFGGRGSEVQGANEDRTELEVLVPRGEAVGPVDVRVGNDNGEVTVEGGFVYFDEEAEDFAVAGIAPASGPVEGGNDLFVAGAGFTAATTVSLEGRQIDCALIDAHQLRCTPPPHEAATVDVVVTSAGQDIDVQGGYTYFQTLELIAVIPDRGSVAGGTVLQVSGTGFVPGVALDLGGQLIEEVEFIDETTLLAVTPASTPGPVDVRLSTEFSRAVIAGGFTYFDPVTRFGGVWGDRIEGAVNVTVLNASTGQPEPEAVVYAITEDEEIELQGLSNARGQLTLSQRGLRGPLSVTAAKDGFEATTIENVRVENITIYLRPNESDGEPPPGVPAAILSGEVTGLDLLPKPVNERYINIIVVETSHPGPNNRSRLPPPGPGGLLREDGPYTIIARPGELAIIATAGEMDKEILRSFELGEIGYWDMRLNLRPLSMGMRRFISASPGQEIEGMDVVLDHPMDFVIPVDLDNPPRGAEGGPEFYAVLPRLHLGAEGYWELDTQAISVEPSLVLRAMPQLDGWAPDLTYYLLGVAFSATADNTPMTITVEETRDVDAGVFVTPFVGAPFHIDPAPGGNLNDDRIVTWGVYDGIDGPIAPPSANLVQIEEPALGPPKPLWFYVTPSLVTSFEFPVLPLNPLGDGVMFLNIFPFIIDGEFDFEEFTYDDLGSFRWKSWGIAATTFSE